MKWLEGKKSTTLPGPSEAVHVVRRGMRSLCGQSMRGEPELPEGTRITCPDCARKDR